MRRWRLAVLFGVLALTAVTACNGVKVKDDTDPLPSAASKQGGVEVWDLRQRPTPAAVGISGDDDTSVYETRPDRTVRLRLADGVSVELPTRYLAFSTILSRDDQVVSVDLKTHTMSRDELVRVLKSILDQLGLPTDAVHDFEQRVRQATGPQAVVFDRVAGEFGELELGVVARCTPDTGRGRVALGGGWLQSDG